jgi:hypothetical protein
LEAVSFWGAHGRRDWVDLPPRNELLSSVGWQPHPDPFMEDLAAQPKARRVDRESPLSVNRIGIETGVFMERSG